jgi:hypothetical protein
MCQHWLCRWDGTGCVFLPSQGMHAHATSEPVAHEELAKLRRMHYALDRNAPDRESAKDLHHAVQSLVGRSTFGEAKQRIAQLMEFADEPPAIETLFEKAKLQSQTYAVGLKAIAEAVTRSDAVASWRATEVARFDLEATLNALTIRNR